MGGAIITDTTNHRMTMDPVLQQHGCRVRRVLGSSAGRDRFDAFITKQVSP